MKPIPNQYVIWLAAICLILLLSSCARLNSIYRTTDIPEDGPHAIMIDAKQRMLLTNKVVDPNDPNSALIRFCAEAPPDVFTAIASSMGANASYALGAAAEQQAALQLSATMSENASTIERSQTVNILREAMYRNCERYLSGAISNDEFIVQAARDQRNMVSVLAIEQLTGVAKAKATALTTLAKASTSGITEAAVLAYDAAYKDAAKQSTAAAALLKTAEDMPPAGKGTCNPIPTVISTDTSSATNIAAKTPKCDEANAAGKKAEDAQGHADSLQEALTQMAATSAEASGKLESAEFNGNSSDAVIAKTVLEIVRENNRFDEIGMSCVVMFRNLNRRVDDYTRATRVLKASGSPGSDLPMQLFTECLNLFRGMVEARTAEAEAETAEANLRANKFESQLLPDDSDRLWTLLKGGTSDYSIRLQAVLALVKIRGVNINPAAANAMAAAGTDKVAFAKAFGGATPPNRAALLKAAAEL